MSAIIACPGCGADISLPEGTHSALICPYCEAEFVVQPMLQQPAGATAPIAEIPSGVPQSSSVEPSALETPADLAAPLVERPVEPTNPTT